MPQVNELSWLYIYFFSLAAVLFSLLVFNFTCIFFKKTSKYISFFYYSLNL